MLPHQRAKVGRFIEASSPISGPWTETRLAFQLGGHTYLITDNFPFWSTSVIIDWLDEIGIKPFEIEVVVSYPPVAGQSWEIPTPGYNSNGTIRHSNSDWSNDV